LRAAQRVVEAACESRERGWKPLLYSTFTLLRSDSSSGSFTLWQ